MVSDADDRRLRILEKQLVADDVDFVAAFRSRSSLMSDARQMQADLRVLGECLRWTGAALVALLLTQGSHAGAAGLCLLLLPAVLGRSRRPVRRSRSVRHRRSRPRPNSTSS